MAKSTKKKSGTTANLGFEAQLWAAADALRNNTSGRALLLACHPGIRLGAGQRRVASHSSPR